MSWHSFLKALCKRQEYGLTPAEIEVVICIQEARCQTKNELIEAYIKSYSNIEEEAFTQRLKNIYKKFKIVGKGHKLPQLHKYLTEQYLHYQNNDLEHKQIDILQTFAPNLNDYFEHFTRCIQNGVRVRILLAWPYSEAAKLREEVLRRYANSSIGDEINIRDCVIANLETLEKIIRVSGNSKFLEVKLYDNVSSG